MNSCTECIDGSFKCEKLRSITNLTISSYNIRNYFSYLLYIPLFLSGPIITFNNFYSQMRSPIPISFQYKALYFLRLMAAIFIMEWIMHNFYVVAIQNSHTWKGFSTLDMFCIGYWNLNLIWLKVFILNGNF